MEKRNKLLFNNNISINASINSNFSSKKSIFQNAKIYFNIINGKINFDKTRLINKKIGSVELNDSSLFYENDKLTLNTNIIAAQQDNETDRFFSFSFFIIITFPFIMYTL